MNDPHPTNDVLLISGDLFLGSRVRSTTEARGHSLVVAFSGEDALNRLGADEYRLVFVDLETPGLDVTRLLHRASKSIVVAYGPHVKETLLESAREAGCQEVLSRGRFDSSVTVLLQRYLANQD